MSMRWFEFLVADSKSRDIYQNSSMPYFDILCSTELQPPFSDQQKLEPVAQPKKFTRDVHML